MLNNVDRQGLSNEYLLFTCKIRRRYSRERASQNLEVIQPIDSFASSLAPAAVPDNAVRPAAALSASASARLRTGVRGRRSEAPASQPLAVPPPATP